MRRSDFHHEEDFKRRAQVGQGLDIHSIQNMQREDLLVLQKALGYGENWGEWEVPPQWIAPVSRSGRMVRIDMTAPESGRIWNEVIKICLLMTLTRGRKGQRGATTVAVYGRELIRLARVVATKSSPSNAWWGRVTSEEASGYIGTTGANRLRALLTDLFKRGLIADALKSPASDGGATEIDRHGEPVAVKAVDDSKTWQPLPDEFTCRCGERVLWLVQELGSALLDCFESCVAIQVPPCSRSSSSKVLGRRTRGSERALLTTLRSAEVMKWDWRQPDGKPIEKLPFSINFKTRLALGKFSGEPGVRVTEDFSWPPRTWGDVVALVKHLQTCHAWLLLLSSGPRASTVLSYDIHCLSDTPAGPRLAGQMFKNTRQFGGRKRDWPLPPILTLVTRQQIRLANAVRGLACPGEPKSLGDYLWVHVHGRATSMGRGSQQLNINAPMERLVDVFGLRHLLDADNPRLHPHRFRKTLARIIALALSSAQIVLMDTFGHEDPDMTLGYMLSDRTILADASRVQRELVVLLAVDAINDIDKLGGPKAQELRSAEREYRRVKGKSHLDPKDVYELADQLTLGGREWRVVMPGVICTLPHLAWGPCGRGKGIRNDPTNCQAGCTHQIILAFHLNQADDKIGHMVELLERAETEQNDMLAANLAPKIQNEMYRWPQLFEKWMTHCTILRHCDLAKKPYWLSGAAS